MRTARRPWDADAIARILMPRRDRLVDDLPRRNRGANGLTRDQLESVVDEAITFVATEYARPLADAEEVERAFWATAAHRIRRVHEGRGETVRAGWRRVDIADVAIADGRDAAEDVVVREEDQQVLLEFAAMLTDRERDVFACKFGQSAKPQGYKLVAQRLGLPVGEVRSGGTLDRAQARALQRDPGRWGALPFPRRRRRSARRRSGESRGGARSAGAPQALLRLPGGIQAPPACNASRRLPA
ncbi:MAG TPA: hypothetical protein VF533_18280 [Solirubrobacteraceae bacterium]|jgi:hypothetical protein